MIVASPANKGGIFVGEQLDNVKLFILWGELNVRVKNKHSIFNVQHTIFNEKPMCFILTFLSLSVEH